MSQAEGRNSSLRAKVDATSLSVILSLPLRFQLSLCVTLTRTHFPLTYLYTYILHASSYAERWAPGRQAMNNLENTENKKPLRLYVMAVSAAPVQSLDPPLASRSWANYT